MDTSNEPPTHGQELDKSVEAEGFSRRSIFQAPLALGIASVAAGSALVIPGEARANQRVKVEPQYFPLDRFRPEVSLAGKLAVITGASRGNGRAIGEALKALGVHVIGTSRNPAAVPNLPAFPLLELDIADPASVLAFPAQLAAHPVAQQHQRVDILCNNAGRLVVGQIAPTDPANFGFYLSQRELAIRTLYSGHVMLTNAMLPMMQNSGYCRIIFTVSIASYYTGFSQAGGSLMDTYNAGKAALRGYANALAGGLRDMGSNIRVSTVNPYAMHTALAEHPNPIYTQPVGPNGLSATDQIFNAVVTGFRQVLANAQPTNRIGTTYAQLLQMTEPTFNVVVASPREPFSTQGANDYIETGLIAENQVSAVPFK